MAQTFQDFEVILINDGSTDNTGEIARSYADKLPRFTLIEQPNAGIGAVRNKGVAQATGAFIAFLDSDDSYLPSYLEALYSAVQTTGADIAVCNFSHCDTAGKITHHNHIHKRAGVYSGAQIAKSALRDVSVRGYLWNKLIRRELFAKANLPFPSRMTEDYTVVPVLFLCAEKVVFLPDRLYLYTKHAGGMTALKKNSCVEEYRASLSALKGTFRARGKNAESRMSFALAELKLRGTLLLWAAMLARNNQSTAHLGKNLAAAFRKIPPATPEQTQKK